jgi:ribosomal protein S18 acetylase RimI-like enzyme
MNDLFVAPEARGGGVAEGLIAACLERCREHGATRLVWQTASDNHRAQAVYARVGATRDDRWLFYDLPVLGSDPAGRRAGSSVVRVWASMSSVAVTPRSDSVDGTSRESSS